MNPCSPCTQQLRGQYDLSATLYVKFPTRSCLQNAMRLYVHQSGSGTTPGGAIPAIVKNNPFLKQLVPETVRPGKVAGLAGFGTGLNHRFNLGRCQRAAGIRLQERFRSLLQQPKNSAQPYQHSGAAPCRLVITLTTLVVDVVRYRMQHRQGTGSIEVIVHGLGKTALVIGLRHITAFGRNQASEGEVQPGQRTTDFGKVI